MNKERLEEIEQIVSDLSNDEIEIREFVNKHFEQVQELESKLDRIRFVNNDYDKQNKRYREALAVINEELELVLHSNKGLAEKMFYIENSKREITEALEGESNE